jgi:signal peptidase I
MSPTFEENDFIIVDKITPRFSDLKRGDVIVFVPPGKTIPYIKRIIGLPGETVKIKSNRVEVCTTQDAGEQCNTVDESYLT